MHRHLALRLKQAALKAARPEPRRIIRALRPHATAAQMRATGSNACAKPVPQGGILRAWLRTLLAALWARRGARPFSLRMLLRHGAQSRPFAQRDHAAYRVTNRRPRRLAASEGWFSFAAR